MISARGFALVAGLALAASLSSTAQAQSGTRDRSTGADAVDAVTTPLRDLNLRSRDIPAILLLAQQQPYSLTGLTNCDALRSEINAFEAILGPDADTAQKGKSLVETGMSTAGNVLGGFIPFRGVVRQISGAKKEEARWRAAVYAGVARRSFLKGYAAGRECDMSNEADILAVRAARDAEKDRRDDDREDADED